MKRTSDGMNEKSPLGGCEEYEVREDERGGRMGAADVVNECGYFTPTPAPTGHLLPPRGGEGKMGAMGVGQMTYPMGDSSAALGMTGEFGFALRTFPQILTFCENFVQIFLYGAYFYGGNENCFSR